MSSDGRSGFGKRPPTSRDSNRSGHFPQDGENALHRHYRMLQVYLASHLRDEKANPKSNRARDKLLRLSATQFLELSTDVYDELTRREDDRLQRLENVPRALPPRPTFHPKRNQARQKLSTLPIERFRQLATDVFYELERRIPRLAAGGIDRPGSSASGRAPSRGGMRPPPPGYRGQPLPPGSGPGGPPRMGPNGPMSPYGSRRPSEAGSLGRPLPKQLQSNTIVPNKGTMVEDDDDDDDEDEDAFGLASPRASHINGEDKEKLRAQESEIVELKEKLEGLGTKLAKREEELSKVNESDQSHADERRNWQNLREELEQKAMDAQALSDELQHNSEQLRRDKEREHQEHVQDLREQLDDLRGQLDDAPAQHEALRQQNEDLHRELQQRQYNEDAHRELQQNSNISEDHERKINLLQEELAAQEKLTAEVRDEATVYLREMRDLSRQNDQAIEQEEKLAAKVGRLEKEIDEWRHRYARVKAQNRSLRASSMGLGLQTGFDAGDLRQEGLISEGGLVRDTDVTRFQLAVDELLKAARRTSSDAMLEGVKNVVISVQAITSAVGTDGYPTPSPSPPGHDGRMQPLHSVGRLQARVTGTANSLITATKQHATSHGLSPVALLDAATSNLTASVVELVKAVHIRPSTTSELHDRQSMDEIGSFYDDVPSPTDEAPPFPLSTATNPSESKSAPPARTASTKKNGWFGWGRRNDEVVSPLPSHAYGEDGHLDPYQ